ncbi:HNH endonuclease [Streptomyces sp. NBC_01775]|uniref:HNH endonuclease n=1 Tax=Streptomyces sp. NBC_01775 TaxID=2975939 RepID=UPI002DD8A656|nr:HNH endonuclease signature motif containing protein [Streptomyces sp. NBC_01775]WSB77629.1 HNH endonuclease [Streptomyces sp. NBC_01775]
MSDGVRRTSLVKVAEFVASRGIGNKFSKLDLFEAVPDVSQADRRMRELRPMGWIIDNYKVNPNLKPDEYLVRELGTRVDLGEAAPKTIRKNITGPKRRRVLERDGHMCQVCGIRAGQVFPDAPERGAIMTIGHIIPVKRGGQNDDGNLRAECQRCGDEARDLTVDPPTAEQVLAHASQGSLKDKRQLYGWMQLGRRTPSDIEKVFQEWSRLGPADRMSVMTALAGQVIKELDNE